MQSFSSGIRTRLTTKPGRVVAADRMLAELLAERVRRLERLVGRQLRADDLDERHQRRRVEEVHADDALRASTSRPRSPSPRARRCSSRARRLPRQMPLELGEERLLRRELLDDRLDHEVAVGEVGEVGRQREPPDRGIAGVLLELPLLDLAREEVRDPVARAARRARPTPRGRPSRRRPRRRAARSPRPSRRARRRRPSDLPRHDAEPTVPAAVRAARSAPRRRR